MLHMLLSLMTLLASVLGVTPRMVSWYPLPALDGATVKAAIVEVAYGPGESSPPHTHPCPVVGYVIEGAVRMQVKGEAEAVYGAGQTFYEAPNGHHMVSANASQTAPARFVAFFICDREAPLIVSPPGR